MVFDCSLSPISPLQLLETVSGVLCLNLSQVPSENLLRDNECRAPPMCSLPTSSALLSTGGHSLRIGPEPISHTSPPSPFRMMLSLHIAGTFQMLTLNSMDLQPSLDFLQFWCKVTLPSPSPQLLLPTPQKSSSPQNLLGFLKKIKFIYLVVPGICRIFCCAL